MADGNAYTRPGVYIQELPGVPTVQSASTSIPVFIGITENLAPSDQNVARRVTGWADYQTRYGSFVFGANVSAAVYEFFSEGGAVCYVVGIAPSSAQKAKADITDPAAKFTFNAACIGDWAKLLFISVVNAGVVPQGQSQTYSSYFTVNVMVKESDVVKAQSPTIWARLLNSYITSNSISPIAIGAENYYVLESFGAFSASSVVIPDNGVCALQAQINAKSFFIRVSVAAASGTTTRAGTPTALTGGSLTALPLDVSNYKQALDALASIPDASLIATPDAAAVDITKQAADGKTLTGIAMQVTQKCAELPRFFYVIDAPYLDVSAADDTNLTNFVMGTGGGKAMGSEHTAIYYPWPIVLNPISGKSVPVPPSGAVLGRYATTDLVAGVHVSPAGVRTGGLATAVSMTRWLTENDQASLNPHGINVIRSIPGYGITIYGARTLSGPGEWQYVAVRRFVTFVEQSLKMSLEWVVFQPNGEMLWGTVVREVTAFLNQLWRQGALFGASASEAFFVTCDNTNNDAATRAQGVLNVDIGLAVLYPAEFVVIRIAQMTTGSA